jgi:hypothetical protein
MIVMKSVGGDGYFIFLPGRTIEIKTDQKFVNTSELLAFLSQEVAKRDRKVDEYITAYL